jgi:hypothetical protein
MTKIEEPPFEVFKHFDGTNYIWSIRDRRAGHRKGYLLPLFSSLEEAKKRCAVHNTEFTLNKFVG